MSRFPIGYPDQPDRLDPAQLSALDGLIGAGVGSTDTLPPLWHWTYFLERPAHTELGADGHPRVGRPTPPAPGLRRMFAGGRVTTHRPLRLDVPAVVRTRASEPVRKEGRTGPLWFVTVRYDYEQNGALAIGEERDIVYRPAAPASPALIGTRSTTEVAELPGAGLDLVVDETVLFGFSALTYNAHRIHYDLAWAEREGYGGLVVHGPLQALLMGEHLRREGQELTGRTFGYRLVAPFVGTQLLRVRPVADAEGGQVAAVYDAAGAVTATATLG